MSELSHIQKPAQQRICFPFIHEEWLLCYSVVDCHSHHIAHYTHSRHISHGELRKIVSVSIFPMLTHCARHCTPNDDTTFAKELCIDFRKVGQQNRCRV